MSTHSEDEKVRSPEQKSNQKSSVVAASAKLDPPKEAATAAPAPLPSKLQTYTPEEVQAIIDLQVKRAEAEREDKHVIMSPLPLIHHGDSVDDEAIAALAAPGPGPGRSALGQLSTSSSSPLASAMSSPPPNSSPLGSPLSDEVMPTPQSSPVSTETSPAPTTTATATTTATTSATEEKDTDATVPKTHRNFAATNSLMQTPEHPSHPDHPLAQADSADETVQAHLAQAEAEALVGRAAITKQPVDEQIIRQVQPLTSEEIADNELDAKLQIKPDEEKPSAEAASATSTSTDTIRNDNEEPSKPALSPVSSSLAVHQTRVHEAEASAQQGKADLKADLKAHLKGIVAVDQPTNAPKDPQKIN